MTIKCERCGKEFEVKPCQVEKTKYCSIKCCNKDRYNQVETECEECGKIFKIAPSRLKIGRGRFCSKKCLYKSQSHNMKGHENPNWNGGTSFEPYCILFNEEFKERVREFWGRQCGICGIHEINNGWKLGVHHVNYDKQTCCNTTIPLFIPTCKSCHPKTNFNRNHWENNLTNYIMIWYNGECYSD